MAVPNYTYLKLKMPGPKGAITVEGSFEQAYYCDQDYVAQEAMLSSSCGPFGSDRGAGRAPAKGEALATVMLC